MGPQDVLLTLFPDQARVKVGLYRKLDAGYEFSLADDVRDIALREDEAAIILVAPSQSVRAYSVIPAPTRPRRQYAAQWMQDQLPEMWVYFTSEPLKATPTLQHTTLGPFAIQDTVCLFAWKLCDAGTDRFNLLKQYPADTLAELIYPCYVNFVVGNRVQTYLYSEPKSFRFNMVDFIVLLGTLLGYTSIGSSELLELVSVYSYISDRRYCFLSRGSRILAVDMLSRMTDSELQLLRSLLEWRYPDHLDFSTPFGNGVYTCPFETSIQTLFKTWMVARAQLGLHTARWDSLDVNGYNSLFGVD